MTALVVILLILAALIGISLIRLGGRAYYGSEGLTVYVIAGLARMKLFPINHEKQQKRNKKNIKTQQPEPDTQERSGKSGTLNRVLPLLPIFVEAAGALKRKIRIDYLKLTVTWGAEDAASAAIGYGKANAALGIIWPLLDHNFRVKKCDWQIDVDYELSTPTFTADAAITITIGQLVSFAVHYGIKVLLNLRKSTGRSEEKQEV